MIDETRQEQAALYVLGGLDAAEAERFSAELRNDAELQAFVAELEDATAQLAHDAPPRTPPPALKQRVLAEIGVSKKIVAMPLRLSWIPWAAAAALAINCGLLWMERQQSTNDRVAAFRDLAAAREDVAKQRAANEDESVRRAAQVAAIQKEVADLRARDALAAVRIQTLSAQVDAYSKALAVVVWDDNTQRGVLKLDKFPKAAAGKDYQLWVIDSKKTLPVSAGIVPVGADGVARIAFKPVDRIDALQKFAISIERAGGAPAPAGQIVALGN